MGGYGSGQYQTPTRKTTVEECLTLDVNALAREGAFKEDIWGTTSWTNQTTGEIILELQFTSYNYQPMTEPRRRGISLWSTGRGSRAEQPTGQLSIPATIVSPYFGGERFYFTCPMDDCDRRVSKLYLPPNESRFACRHCHNLGYQSQRLSKKHRMIIQDSINQYLARRRLPLAGCESAHNRGLSRL